MGTRYQIIKRFFFPENWDPYARVEYSNIFEQCLGAEILKKQNRILKLIISYSYCLIGASKQQNLHQAGPKQALIAPKWLLVGLVTQTNWIDVITNFISIVFKICGSSKSNNLSFDQNHLIKNPILFRKYLSPQKLLKNVWVFNTRVWISVFRRKKKRFENPGLGCRDLYISFNYTQPIMITMYSVQYDA